MGAEASQLSRRNGVNLPPLLLGASLLVWGGQSGQLFYALPIALLLEAGAWVSWRAHLSKRVFNRIADLSTLALLVLLVYELDTHSFPGISETLKLLPLVLVPLIVAQTYSTASGISLASLFLSIRYSERRGRIADPPSVDFSKVYFVTCLVSATVTADSDARLYGVLCALVLWSIWSSRPRRTRVEVWLLLAMAAVALGWAGQLALFKARSIVEPLLFEVVRDNLLTARDPYKSFTAMGEIGRLKLSDRILFRVEAVANAPVPPLLREASYQTFSKNLWLSSKGRFEPLAYDKSTQSWRLEPSLARGRSVAVSRYLKRGAGLLPVPSGTVRIDNLPAGALLRNSQGVLKVQDGPELVHYRAHYVGPGTRAAPADKADRFVPSDLAETLAPIVAQLGLEGAPAREVVAKIERYFDHGFGYSLNLVGPGAGGAPIENFLLNTRSGHCEFFASATTLLLRAAGVPARYTTGYSVQEWSELERRYIVRRRHAHAWASAYIDGSWYDVDTTPAVWSVEENKHARWWAPLYDAAAWATYRYAAWRKGLSGEQVERAMLWCGLAVGVGLLAWRFARRRARPEARSVRHERDPGTEQTFPGADSEFYEVVTALTRAQMGPLAGESLEQWLRRLERRGNVRDVSRLRLTLLPLHYRYRFDPFGLSDRDREALQRLVREWVTRFAVVGD